MEQKFIKVGSSMAAVIPKFMKEKAGIRLGEKYKITQEEHTNRIIIEPAPAITAKKGSSDLIAWAEEAVERYRPALEALKDK